MTFEEIMGYVVPALVLAAIFGGLRISSKVDSLQQTVENGLKNLHADITDLKIGRNAHETRIHLLEVAQARRLGREEERESRKAAENSARACNINNKEK